MSWRDAPLYPRCHDLALDLHQRCGQAGGPHAALGERLCVRSLDLLAQVSEALSFPDTRAAAQSAADRSVAELKVLVRLAVDAGALSPGGGRHLGAELVEIGRMLGGWQRRHARSPPSGDRPSPPPGA